MDIDLEYEELKTKVLSYVLYKKRTEREIRQKFSKNSGNTLENVIEYLKEEDYINDKKYIQKSVKEYIALKNLSIKEIYYKLFNKGINTNLIQEYINDNKEELVQYEMASAINIVNKKNPTKDKEEIKEFLRKKGYLEDIINNAIEGE